MSHRLSRIATAATLTLAAFAGLSGSAQAQSSVTIYGTIDEYFNYMRSSSGSSFSGLEDGALLRSRLGFRGTEDLGGGLAAKFVLEGGLDGRTGGQADATRNFDRQSWVGLASSYGEVRLGRQNGVVFGRGDYIDFTTRTLGSIINTFGVPSRYDNDISYISPRIAGVLAEVHYSLGETQGGLTHQAVTQAGVDYLNGPYRIGYAGLRAKAPTGAVQPAPVIYDNFYANYDYGQGLIYLAHVRTNNNTSTAVSNNAGTILGNVGGLVAGTNADVNHYYGIWQLSADYRVTPLLRVGALWGRIQDTSNRGRGANGGSVAAYYSLSKRTTVYGITETLRNDRNAGFRLAGSAGLQANFTSPNDINGRTINGMQLGILHKF